MGYSLNESQQAQLDKPIALSVLPYEWGGYVHNNGFTKSLVFHQTVGLTITSDWSATPPMSERVLWGKMLIEEVFETLKAMGLRLDAMLAPTNEGDGAVFDSDGGYLHDVNYDVGIEGGGEYDPIETADGLADIKVIVNGTAVSFGIPIVRVDEEVFASNMSKLDAEGKPIVNRCTWSVADCRAKFANEPCNDSSHLIDPTKPVGKVLKPDTYVPANVARIYKELGYDS